MSYSDLISSPIFSGPTNTSYFDPSLLHPPPPVPHSSPSSPCSFSSSDCEDFTLRMDQLDSVKRRMFPPPMTAGEFIERNPFVGADGHIKRPSNNFILFRKIAHDQKNQAPNLSNYNERQWSQIVGRIWKTLSVEEKKDYKKLGEQVAKLHHEMFPEYKYQPKRDKAAWKHFNPIENNTRKSKSKRKIRTQQKQPTEIITSFENIPQQEISPLDSTLNYTTQEIAMSADSVHPGFLFDESYNFENNFAFNVDNVNEIWLNLE